MPPPTQFLHVIALISGGKDSFFTALHCIQNGHRIIALANLHPPAPPPSHNGSDADREDEDLDSFMYQTEGHEVIPFYAEATGLPLYRHEIAGGATVTARDYGPAQISEAMEAGEDETESMTHLLREVMEAHPEANAVCAGAILSSYQRTRVESVAIRLGLVPLAYLWEYPSLPAPRSPQQANDVLWSRPKSQMAEAADQAQLLMDMEASGLDARIIKVASAGLQDDMLWTNVASADGTRQLRRRMRQFAGEGANGAIIGEGGDYETLVVDGPAVLFKGRIEITDDHRRVVRDGGAAWLRLKTARVRQRQAKLREDFGQAEDGRKRVARRMHLLDIRFKTILPLLRDQGATAQFTTASVAELAKQRIVKPQQPGTDVLTIWTFRGSTASGKDVEQQTRCLFDRISQRLKDAALAPTAIISIVVLLRHMSDFPAVNKIYKTLFAEPNPPSRVTISCGLLLPEGCHIDLTVTLRSRNASKQRDGLHVQSQSYWAPANIGPYSQAISLPIQPLGDQVRHEEDTGDATSRARIVHIAGQIPLIPASMELPDDTRPGSFELSLALSLQHLWRIGTRMQVSWWSSAVAYLPRQGQHAGLPIRERAEMAFRTWRLAHLRNAPIAEDDDAETDGPDAWDLKHNPAYRDLAADSAESRELPVWSLLADAPTECECALSVPFMFAAKVEELPRGAGVEWHAHAGLGHLDAEAGDRVRVRRQTVADDAGHWYVEQCILQSGNLQWTSSIVSCEETSENDIALQDLMHHAARSLSGHSPSEPSTDGALQSDAGLPRPYLVYVAANDDMGKLRVDSSANIQDIGVIPCFSLWGPAGQRYKMIALYRSSSVMS